MRASEVLALLAEAGVQPRGMTVDSRRVREGDVFIAWRGVEDDGRRYIEDALSHGAAAVLHESNDGFCFPKTGQPVFAVEGLHAVAGSLADEFYGRPSEKLWLAGVTGTNGKTTVSQWIGCALEAFGVHCGLIGTLGSGFPGALAAGSNTTPDAVELHRLFADFVASGARAAAMEVSSIGIDQGRVNGARFDVAAFTNLTRDHIDYHGSMQAYAESKARFFDLPGVSAAVINIDDDFGMEQAGRLAAHGMRVIGASLADRAGTPMGMQKLVGANLRASPTGLCFDVVWEGHRVALDVCLAGTFNASNLLVVIGVLLQHGEALDDIAQVVKTLTPPPGRMQLVGGNGEPMVIVDYAHTPDALTRVLETARETARSREGRLICVFGCGGGRDPGKRPLMGEVATKLADRVIVTSDNPRNEEPQKIIDDILKGAGTAVEAETDRAKAIRAAVAMADPRDVILVAGKGHEPYQEICGERRPFSDCDQAAQALAARRRLSS
ncbi:MAG: UDP-N-acetylmuramoyl-L-alanyl-D-glutamate--2,6-diaminopimelate ligase [Azoarcus sp.]|jgi:UDP-N-acetylmuramoyl-L-alanyl-D-glutamate--2,6-diaminopimelate ligase|nr:UDP-N-acetylmuramoyl-L-alanyl-D-glutamate--2,6-diaminopimelate ligase [Azoarcus sp.]